MTEQSLNEKRIRKIIQLYYSRKDVQETICTFCKNRETVPRYFEGFGKRPDSLEYPNDVFELAKKGATSIHCSQELWQDPLLISTNMSEEQLNKQRFGWDLLIDIDSKYIDYSKIMAQLIKNLLEFHGVKNIGVKFSGSKGFHMIVPSKSFPKEINNVKTSNMFPEWPRIITKYIMKNIERDLIKKISALSRPNKYVTDFEAPKEVMPDLVLVSPRHLFRAPYSLHEKTALASVVINKNKIDEFEMIDADPMKVKVKEFLPDAKEGEAKELIIQALDWYKDHSEEKKPKKDFTFKPIKLDKISEEFFPPSIQKILKGVNDGKKRALFILINLFRSLGMEKEELEERIYAWNKKNKPPLKTGYIKSQLMWSYRNKIVLPPNYEKDYYKGIGVEPTPEELRFKNPVTWVVKKSKAKS